MEIVSAKIENMADYEKVTSSIVYSAIIKIVNIEGRADAMIKAISDTSWLNVLAPVEQASFNARSKRTIIKLAGLIKSRVTNEVSADFGEYMISDSAQTMLQQHLGHNKVPLAELLKEKISGNPGFDFHTESKEKHIAFGEAKYSSSTNPHADAIVQICEFIELEKDIAELTTLQHFVSKESIQKSLHGAKGYVAAFSINSKNPELIMKNALKSKNIDALLSFPEVFIIGIQVDD